jgi:hypothetical protein
VASSQAIRLCSSRGPQICTLSKASLKQVVRAKRGSQALKRRKRKEALGASPLAAAFRCSATEEVVISLGGRYRSEASRGREDPRRNMGATHEKQTLERKGAVSLGFKSARRASSGRLHCPRAHIARPLRAPKPRVTTIPVRARVPVSAGREEAKKASKKAAAAAK